MAAHDDKPRKSQEHSPLKLLCTIYSLLSILYIEGEYSLLSGEDDDSETPGTVSHSYFVGGDLPK